MDRQEALKRLEEIKTPSLFGDFVGYYGARDLIDEIYKTPLYLRNVLTRLRELPEHDRKVWMDEIMHEFANDYGSVKYTLGYERGKLEGALEANEKQKVVIPQFVAEWIEKNKKRFPSLYNVYRCIGFYNINVDNWISKNPDKFARAWLDGYEVEKEKLYTAKLKLITISCVNYINKRSEDGAIVLSDLNAASGAYQTSFSRSELEQLNVWDNPVFEIEEVE